LEDWLVPPEVRSQRPAILQGRVRALFLARAAWMLAASAPKKPVPNFITAKQRVV
jgi:hypothetical protein